MIAPLSDVFRAGADLKRFLLFAALVLGWAPQAHADGVFISVFGEFCIAVDPASLLDGRSFSEGGVPTGAICIPLDVIEAGLNDAFSRLGPGECLETGFGTVCMPPALTPPPVPVVDLPTMYEQSVQVFPAELQTSVQFALNFAFGADLESKLRTLLNLIRRLVGLCDLRNPGDLCSLTPPATCVEGRFTSGSLPGDSRMKLCTGGMPSVPFLDSALSNDAVRMVFQQIQMDRCPGSTDVDEDNVCDNMDNCPGIANQDQADSDADGTGDACKCTARTMQDRDDDGQDDCLDICLLPTNRFSFFVPNVAGPNCGCQPLALAAAGQIRPWSGGPGNTGVPHLDAVRCNLSGDAPPTAGEFMLRDLTRQAVNRGLPEHLHNGLLGSFFPGSAAFSQELVTKAFIGSKLEIVSKQNMTDYANPATLEDRAAVDAQIGAQMFHDFLRTIPGPEGLPLVSISDPDPAPIASMISVILPSGGATPPLGATIINGVNSFVAYPKRNGLYGSAALDTVGHEWFHAFLSLSLPRNGIRPVLSNGLSTAPRTKRNKAYAVEEAYADAIGVGFEITVAQAGRIPGKPSADFRVSEDVDAPVINLARPRDLPFIYPPHVLDSGFQALCNPDNRRQEPISVALDCEGPFVKAFHLLAAGGSFPQQTDRDAGGGAAVGYDLTTAPTVTVTGIGVPLAMRIVFRAGQTQWAQDQSYGHYVGGMIRAARNMGLSTAQVQSVINSLRAVGLTEFRVTIPITITPAGAGTVTAPPTLLFDGDLFTLRATAATGRQFGGFVLRNAVGQVLTLPPNQNPATIQAVRGLRIEARFN